MNLAKTILAGSVFALIGVTTASAVDTYVHITGATAFRSPAISAIKTYLTTTYGGYTCIYGQRSGVTSENNAGVAAFVANGTIGSGTAVIIKCSWGGSVGGVKLIQSTTTFNIDSQPGVPGWIADGALSSVTVGTTYAGTQSSTTPGSTVTGQDAATYVCLNGSTAPKADAAFTDAYQSTALGGLAGDAVSAIADPDGKVGIIPFNWVISNGVTASSVTQYTGVSYGSGSNIVNYTGRTGSGTSVGKTIGGKGIPIGTTITADSGTQLTLSANTTSVHNGSPTTTNISSADTASPPFSNITQNQSLQLILGGARLSMFTGVSGDSTTGVYAYGRNADSGTRISCLGESGRGVTKNPGAHIIPTFTPAGTGSGKGGSPGNVVSTIAKWPTETVLGTFYSFGAGGYTSGGDLSGALSAPGAQTSTADNAGGDSLSGRPGWVIGYVGRSDANASCATTFGQNTAKRLTFCSERDWLGTTFKDDGSPVSGFDDTKIREGVYSLWEYEHFYRSVNASAAAQTVLTAIGNSLTGGAAPSGSISLVGMNVSRSVEGGAISHN